MVEKCKTDDHPCCCYHSKWIFIFSYHLINVLFMLLFIDGQLLLWVWSVMSNIRTMCLRFYQFPKVYLVNLLLFLSLLFNPQSNMPSTNSLQELLFLTPCEIGPQLSHTKQFYFWPPLKHRPLTISCQVLLFLTPNETQTISCHALVIFAIFCNSFHTLLILLICS